MINNQKRVITILVALLLLIIGVVWMIKWRAKSPSSENSLQPGQGQGLTPTQKEQIIQELAPKKGEEQKAVLAPEEKAEIIQQFGPPLSTSNDGQPAPAPKGLTPEQKKKILDALAPQK